MPHLAWRPDYELGVRRMDDTHREFVALLDALGQAPEGAFLAALDQLIEHTVEHFAQENRWMERTEFGPLCHIAEHHHVLNVARQVRAKVSEGDVALGRKLASELVVWFEHHASTMDTMLASHMARVGFDPDAPDVAHVETGTLA